MESWYALHTKPRSELRVFRILGERGFGTYLPLLPERRDRRGEPLFPTYLFVRCDLEIVGLSSLEWIPGLHHILAFDGQPAVVPAEAIDLIQAKMLEIEARGGLPQHAFQTGDEVVINEGPLRGIRGIFQGPTGPAERVQILIQFLGQANRAEVPVELLQAVPEDEKTTFARHRGTRGHGRRIHQRDEPG